MQIEAPQVENGEISMRLSDVLSLTLRVEGAPGLEVDLPRKLVNSPDWEVRTAKKSDESRAADASALWEKHFRLEPVRPGDSSLTLGPLRMRASPEADWREISWQAIAVHVTSEIEHADRSELRATPPPEELPSARIWRPSPVWVVAVVVAVGVVAAGWWLRRRLVREVPVPPDRWALQIIDRLDSGKLETEAEIAQAYDLLSNTVRRYVELQFQLRAPEQTTTEFLQSLDGSPLPVEQRAVVRDFLQYCDLVKFARLVPSAEQCQSAIATARAFIEQSQEVSAEAQCTKLSRVAQQPGQGRTKRE
jgi:hypothetical protein